MAILYRPLASAHQVRVVKLDKKPFGRSLCEWQCGGSRKATCIYLPALYLGRSNTEKRGPGIGRRAPVLSVLINGHSLDIGLNLKNTLSHLHGVLVGRVIWIDAICINQRDVLKRNAQVATMNHIYEQASDVVVWLGDSTPAWEWAIKNIDRSTLTLQGYWKAYPQARETCWEPFTACEATDDEHVDIIHFVAGNRWFSCTWTLQKHIMAREVRFLCGDILTSLETIWKGGMMATLAGVTTA